MGHDECDRYRSKVNDLGMSGSSKDLNKLPRNEQKLRQVRNLIACSCT